MSTKELAEKLADYCKAGEFEKAQEELYHEDVVSVEPHETPLFNKETKGKKALEEKMIKFRDSVQDYHGITVSQPVVAPYSFAFSLGMDVTMKEGGRMDMRELCVYQVKDGKIISESFYI